MSKLSRSIAKEHAEHEQQTAIVNDAAEKFLAPKIRAIDVYVPVCVTLLIDETTGQVVSDGATDAQIDYDGMPWSNNEGDVWDFLTETWGPYPIGPAEKYFEDSDAGDVAINAVQGALDCLEFPDAPLADQWFIDNVAP